MSDSIPCTKNCLEITAGIPPETKNGIAGKLVPDYAVFSVLKTFNCICLTQAYYQYPRSSFMSTTSYSPFPGQSQKTERALQIRSGLLQS